ncbi:MAG: hypothetical protein AB8H80_09485 [Planctomycetota bacterium]
MTLPTWFFGSQTHHANRVDDMQRGRRRARRRASQRRNALIQDLANDVTDLREDLGYVTLVLGSVLAKLDEKGTLSRADVQATMAELDVLDGVADGKLDIDVLKSVDEADPDDVADRDAAGTDGGPPNDTA